MSAALYGVGVGPGDPKLMTCLAVETIEKCPVIAVPAEGKGRAVSYEIASGMVKGLAQKHCIHLSTPMTKDRRVLDAAYQEAAEKIIEQLKAGKDVAYLTLGDPTVYSTYIYIHRLVKSRGFAAQIINGVPSFCAVSAVLGDSLADRGEQLHIIPSTYDIEEALMYPGTKILMKAASKMPEVKKLLKDKNMQCAMVENCGMENEKIYETAEEIPDQASYFSVIVARADDALEGKHHEGGAYHCGAHSRESRG